MRNLKSIIFQPIVLALLLSLGAHGMIWLRQDSGVEPARPQLKKGRTVVQLSLQPTPPTRSVSAPAMVLPKSQPTTQIAKPIQQQIKSVSEQVLDLADKMASRQPVKPQNQTETAIKPPEKIPPLPPVTPQPQILPPEPAPIEENKTEAPAPAQPTTMGIVTEAQLLSEFKPDYPSFSRRRGEEGAVHLQVQIRSDGSVGEVEIISSSGSKRLDKAAQKAAKKCPYTPALKDGKPVDSTTDLHYIFRLEND